MVDTEGAETALFPERAGDILRSARIAAGLDLADIATKTRVPLRHLESIEGGDYSGLPSPTYCIGFVKAYARAVGSDERALAELVRAELDHRAVEKTAFVEYEISDQKQMPSRILAWTAAAMAVLVIIGFVVWRNMTIADPRDAAPEPSETSVEASVETPVSAQNASVAAPIAKPTGQVTLTATGPVWFKIYELGGKRIFEKEMAVGESYTIPADAIKPQIITGRPEALRVSVGGQDVAPLGPPERTVKDIEMTAQALTARPPVPVAPSPAPAPQP